MKVTISTLGGRGDGIAETDAGRIFVPYTLAGETVDITPEGSRGKLIRVIEPSSHRIEPVCPHYSVCGGCNLQHVGDDAYNSWKRGIVKTALSHKGLDASVDELIDAHGAGRRRVTFHVRFSKGDVIVGFMEARSHNLLQVETCPVLTPPLANAAAIARDLARACKGAAKKLDILITSSDGGLDCNIRGCGRNINLDTRLDLTDVAQLRDLARVSVEGDLVLERHVPVLKTGGALVTLPAGGFLQATGKAEQILSKLVVDAIGPAKKAADLFSGVGPFALRLAPIMAVHAVDNDEAAIAALTNAARHTQGLKPLTVERRDLVRNPVHASDLTPYDAVVFDPPRAGAEEQARELAASTVPVVVAVSCDPASFSRDAVILTQGGYRLEKVTPVDQFRYTAHVELVAVFRR